MKQLEEILLPCHVHKLCVAHGPQIYYKAQKVKQDSSFVPYPVVVRLLKKAALPALHQRWRTASQQHKKNTVLTKAMGRIIKTIKETEMQLQNLSMVNYTMDNRSRVPAGELNQYSSVALASHALFYAWSLDFVLLAKRFSLAREKV